MLPHPIPARVRQSGVLIVAAVFPASITLSQSALPEPTECDVTPSPYWSNTIEFPDDPFRVAGMSNDVPGWVKFTILLCDPATVYFQDSNAYPFHYEFATEQLDPLLGITPEEFELITLYEEGQQAILGAVVMPPYLMGEPSAIPEYGIQFVRYDPYQPEEIVDLFELVRSNVIADAGVEALYFPTYEQLATAEANRDFFESQGIIVSSTARWATGNSCYSTGWALGELKYVQGDQIEDAYLNGTLGPDDILLTDGVPATVPYLAGIITLTPSTPNSHVVILANTFGVPFAHLAIAEHADRALELVGHRIGFRACGPANNCNARLIDVEGVLTEQQISEILTLKVPPTLNISPIAAYGAYSASTEGLVLSDIQYFGGKAANYGFLRRTIPDSSPMALAISFDLWTEFLDQTLGGESTLREEISARLSGYTYPPDMAALADDLDDIRDMFKDTDVTSFTPAQEDAIIAILQDPQYGFDPQKKIRFRSSTNVEDSEQFTGAGLYDSYSGCLADDLDGDDDGPSICDPSKEKERGVFRAIRKVFASLYNDKAFLERLRYGVSEDGVGMAILVHHSFPDEIELANGVATLSQTAYSSTITLVTQAGAVSVTNPEEGAIPEVVEAHVWQQNVSLLRLQGSNLVQLGATVLEWDQEYRDLALLLDSVAGTFKQETGKVTFLLDFEYKKVAPGGGALPGGGLVVKQVREIPPSDNTPSMTPFLINEPAQYCIFQGEYADVFANHRLKSRWMIETGSFWLTEENLTEVFYTMADLEYTDGCHVRSVSGPLSSWPGASYAYDPEDHKTTAGWISPPTWNPRSYELEATYVGQLTAPSIGPLVTLRDFGTYYCEWGDAFGCLNVRVDYAEPVPSWQWPDPITTTTDYVRICRCPQEDVEDRLQERVFEGPDGMLITTLFYWPLGNYDAGYTAPLVRWVETTIEGLTSDPIILHGWYSQTYKPEHHNFSEHFIFDPFLEPDVPRHLLQELRDQRIRLIHILAGYSELQVTFYGDEGVCEGSPIPAVSEWGVVWMTLLVLAAGSLTFRRGSGTRAVL